MDEKEIQAHHEGVRDGYEMAVEDVSEAMENAKSLDALPEAIRGALSTGLERIEREKSDSGAN